MEKWRITGTVTLRASIAACRESDPSSPSLVNALQLQESELHRRLERVAVGEIIRNARARKERATNNKGKGRN
jgi:hypothetical protein